MFGRLTQTAYTSRRHADLVGQALRLPKLGQAERPPYNRAMLHTSAWQWSGAGSLGRGTARPAIL